MLTAICVLASLAFLSGILAGGLIALEQCNEDTPEAKHINLRIRHKITYYVIRITIACVILILLSSPLSFY